MESMEEISLARSLLELRNEGNKYFRCEDWNKAIDFYSKCIDLALSRHKIEPQGVPSASNIQEKVKETLVCSYSNRAEARIKLKEYGTAVEDCDEALALDQLHLKSLFRKGRAFHYLREYKLACQCFGRALQQNPTSKEIQSHYDKSKELNNQNQKGEFDLSAYFINGCCNAPEISNYIGPVLIKKSVGRGRGMFATDNINVGDFLVADNAIALTFIETTRSKGRLDMIEVNTKHGHVKRDLKGKIISCAASSPRVLQQLEYLVHSDKTRLPPMDLFRVNNGSWNNYDACNQSWEVNQHKIAKIMQYVGCHRQIIELSREMSREKEQYGLWVLPSFFNNSCLPNANCLIVGEVAIIIASRKIEAGEEIEIPYIPVFEPLLKRESAFRRMGFKCECKRCTLERSKASPLQAIAKLVDSTILLSDIQLLAAHATRVEYILNVLKTDEKQMIRASFYHLYNNIFVLGRIHPHDDTLTTNLPSLREVFDGFQEVVPGNYACLHMFARLLVSARSEGETDKVLLHKALEVCRGYMGKHEEGLLTDVLNSVAAGVFKPGITVFGMTELNK